MSDRGMSVIGAAHRPEHQGAPSLELIGLTKRFGALHALDDVSLKVQAGAFHALLGENGAGKSTLVKCVMGYYAADEGQVLVDGREVEIANPREAHALGIGMVYQHFTLVPNMTVPENLVLARERPARGDRLDERARRAGGLHLDHALRACRSTSPVADLAAGREAEAGDPEAALPQAEPLILDEPTSVLTPDEADEVLRPLQRLTQAGESPS